MRPSDISKTSTVRPVGPLDHILDLEPQLGKALESALKKLVNGPFTAHTPAGSWLGDEDDRACENRVGGLVAHQHTQAGEF